MHSALAAYDAIVLAGGRSRRMGGEHKPVLQVAGRSLLDRVLDAVAEAAQTVVVGPRVPTRRAVAWTREEPPGGGPVAALGAGLPVTSADWIAVLAADLPFVTATTVDTLRIAALGGIGAVASDPDGAPQWLLGIWSAAALRTLDLTAGRSARDTLDRLGPRLVPVVAVGRPAYFDCDTPADIDRARTLA